MNVMEFFQQSAGQWQSQRTTHHLPFRRAELGGSNISVEALPADNEKVVEICKLHDVDPSSAVGGAYVQWNGEMAWDKEGEDHKGSTVFALVPDADNPQTGNLLRERGYAEIVPVIGRFEMDSENGLVLTTEYETMSSIERFWFPNSDLRMRTSVVKRFGGLSTASFCAESRVETVPEKEKDDAAAREAFAVGSQYSAFGW
ncbi:phycobiliprotein lyase [cf. Phormidesmis sp. LEGE 11477]|uniref:phycobiliprotein lyase n=1 Tax=cf. Phormidesmis sp. LEGE 11477 TaxID=1828680 RepID=UPI001881412E|nr:phycobiliprotein lyase [cf. Phormidesmis sp. LEGE 11477]MBE9060205.1 phycobiliprotein lyase [cf. Phormidesmis sp. LEGE 11477]